MDAQGAEAVRPWTTAAGATFPTAIDSENRLAQIYGYKVVPNGIFLDADGALRYLKFGGFDVQKQDQLRTIERLMAGEQLELEPEGANAPYQLSEIERELIETRLRLGAELLRRGEREAAIAEWRAALYRDPENLTIRKQLWMTEHPERFHPNIDFAWQQEQLQRERADEIAQGICGPDGCPLPANGSA